MTELRGEIVVLTPLHFDDAARLREIRHEVAVHEWWGAMEDEFPFDEPESTRFTVKVDGQVAGMVQYGEEEEPEYRHAWIDIFLSGDFHGRGIGTDAVRTLARHLVDDRGHHRITIDPSVANQGAVRAYEKAGFTPVGVLRLAERAPDGTWRDSLLMEQVFPAVVGLSSDERPS
jgi:aminoglycoside 6'-N-acetyltransferase